MSTYFCVLIEYFEDALRLKPLAGTIQGTLLLKNKARKGKNIRKKKIRFSSM